MGSARPLGEMTQRVKNESWKYPPTNTAMASDYQISLLALFLPPLAVICAYFWSMMIP